MRKSERLFTISRFRSATVSTLSEAIGHKVEEAAVAASSSGCGVCRSKHDGTALQKGVAAVAPNCPAAPAYLGHPQRSSTHNSPASATASSSSSSSSGCISSRGGQYPAAGPAGAAARRRQAPAFSYRTASMTTHTRGFAASAADDTRSGGDGGGNGRMQGAASEVVPSDQAARMVLEDPMSRLMASQGMPVGLSLRNPVAPAGPAAGSSSSNSGGRGSSSRPAAPEEDAEDLTKPPSAEPAYQMEAFSDMLRATAAAARRSGEEAGFKDGGGGGFTAGVQRVGPSLDDSWGTTRESPADIARRIVESNLEAERGAVGNGSSRPDGLGAADSELGGHEDDDDDEGPELPMALSPSEQKYASLEAMSAEIKKLDEVFEVLASVPWLDEDVLAEKELKGVARVGLLGTLEEVGFNIRPQLLRIWAGERGAELAAGPGLEFRDQAALLAILYHTQQIEDKYGPPPGGYVA